MKTHKQQLRNLLRGVARTKDFDDFYEDISRDWQEKARKLRERRWRKLDLCKDEDLRLV